MSTITIISIICVVISLTVVVYSIGFNKGYDSAERLMNISRIRECSKCITTMKQNNTKQNISEMK